MIHSENYKKPDVFAGQRVMIIGAGESGSDICNEVAQVAAKVAIVVRGKHGHLIPRKQADGRVTDLNTNRVRYSNPYILGDWVGFANQHAKKFVAKWGGGKDPEEALILQTIGKLNLQQGTSAFSKFGCKNEGFVTAMVTKGTELHRDGFKLNKVTVYERIKKAGNVGVQGALLWCVLNAFNRRVPVFFFVCTS